MIISNGEVLLQMQSKNIGCKLKYMQLYDLSEWILERDNYILKNNRLPFPWSDEGRFVLNCSTLEAPGKPKIAFQVIVSKMVLSYY